MNLVCPPCHGAQMFVIVGNFNLVVFFTSPVSSHSCWVLLASQAVVMFCNSFSNNPLLYDFHLPWTLKPLVTQFSFS